MLAISEGISILKSWNNSWIPKTFMVDNCEEEITALEEKFPGTTTNSKHKMSFRHHTFSYIKYGGKIKFH